MKNKTQLTEKTANRIKPVVKRSAKITVKCIMCGKKEVLTDKQIEEAQILGNANSSCCRFMTTVEKVVM